MTEPTQERLKELLFYDPVVGILVRKVRTAKCNKIGEIIKSTKNTDYPKVRIDSRKTPCHRVAWIYCFGKIPPDKEVDHINRNRFDYRISNLRLVSKNQNKWNMTIPNTNKSGYKGVSWHKQRKKWRVIVCYMSKNIEIGYFDCKIEAAMAYNKAASEYFGKYANLNVIEEGA